MKIKILLVLFSLESIICLSQTVIYMKKENGVYTVPCTVNGLKLHFIFDTGASVVSISITEALFMLKNGYLSKNEIYGITYAQLANGEITENTQILLKEIIIEGLSLSNIKASIAHELSAPLLLGQSVIQKLGTIQIDGNKLTILHKKNNLINSNSVNNDNNSNFIFTDLRDNQKYKTVKIWNQTWMAENLNYQTNNYSWCYDNKTSNCDIYGRLYDWKTALNVCPSGWHLPSIAEWTQLTSNLGDVAGGKLKATNDWKNPNYGADNSSGFSGLPGGDRGSDGAFNFVGIYGFWWSASEFDATYAWHRTLFYNGSAVEGNVIDKSLGFSVRCVKDF